MTQFDRQAGRLETDRWTEIRATLTLAVPLVVTMLAVMVMETVDILMIGRLGEDALAGASLGLNAWFLCLLFGLGVLGAVSSLTAQAVAVGDDRGVRRSARQALWIGIMLGAPMAYLLTHAEGVLILLDQPPRIAAAAQEYLNWLGPVLVVVFLTYPLRLTMASYGVTRVPMLIVWSSVPLNFLLNWMLIFGNLGAPEMGLAGAGASTLAVDIVVLIGTVIYLQKKPMFRDLALFARFWRPDWPRFRQLLKIGMPIGITSIMEYGSFAAAAIMMGWIGVTELAAHQVAVQTISVVFMLPFGLSQAATIRVALAAGARDLAAVRLRARIFVELIALTMISVATCFWLWGHILVGYFLSPDDPNRTEIITFGTMFLMVAALFQISDGIQAVGSGVLRGMNDTVVSMVLAIFGYWAFGVGSAYIMAFPLGYGGVGIWYGFLLGLSFCAFGALTRIWYLTRVPERAFHKISDAAPQE